MKNLTSIASCIAAYYIIVCEDNCGGQWLWNGNWHELKDVELEGKHRALYIYLATDKPQDHFATLMKRGGDVWEVVLEDAEEEADRVLPLKATCRLIKVSPALTVVKDAS